MRVGIKVVTLIVIWSAMDTILLFFFLKGFRAKEKMGIFTTISYLFYFLLNFVFGIKNVNIWIHILCNIYTILY